MKPSLSTYRKYETFGLINKSVEMMDAASKQLTQMETNENMETFARKIAADWKKTDNNVASLKLAFSDFEKIMESKRTEINNHLGSLRNERIMLQKKHNLHDSTVL